MAVLLDDCSRSPGYYCCRLFDLVVLAGVVVVSNYVDLFAQLVCFDVVTRLVAFSLY